jgi:serpin B
MANQFQFNIFFEICKSKIGENIIISPFSINNILSLTANGAKNKTLDEMIKVLCHKTKEEMNKENEAISSFTEKFESVTMSNAIFSKNKPKENFLEIAKQYKAHIDLLEDAQQINKWCENATKGKITKIVDNISSDDLMILINTIIFKGEWERPFEKEKTQKNDFFNFGKEKKEIDFMKDRNNFLYFESHDTQAVSLPYKKDNIEAIIILPKKEEEEDINKYIKNFTIENYNEIIKNVKKTKIILSLPKFKIEYEDELKPYFIKMGMVDAFGDDADFSEIEKGNKIGKILHKTYIKIDEEGTEAAAVTEVEMSMKGSKRKITRTPIMDVNHPFLLMLRSNNLPNGHDILFISKIESL